MKYKNILVIIILSSLFIIVTAAKIKFISYATECVSIESDKYITINIWNGKKGSNYKNESAQKEAIHAILYSGISNGNSCTTQNPILSNLEQRNNFKKIENKFFRKKGEWNRFIKSSNIEKSLPISIGSQNWKVYQVAIAKNELRKYLEEEKIIHTLSNGF